MSSVVLDASAMLAYLFDEDGVGLVETALNDSACIGAINWAEVLSKVEDIRPQTKLLGLSLGDRACLALGMRLEIPVLTADTAWNDLTLNISIRMIR